MVKERPLTEPRPSGCGFLPWDEGARNLKLAALTEVFVPTGE